MSRGTTVTLRDGPKCLRGKVFDGVLGSHLVVPYRLRPLPIMGFGANSRVPPMDRYGLLATVDWWDRFARYDLTGRCLGTWLSAGYVASKRGWVYRKEQRLPATRTR